MRLLVIVASVLLLGVVRAQTAAPFPPLVYTYEGGSAPSSVLEAVSTAGAPARSILAESGSDTATAVVGAFQTTATIGDTISPVAATSPVAFSSASPGEVLSTATRPPYTKIGTVDPSLASATVPPTPSQTSAADRRAGGAWRLEAVAALIAGMVGGAAYLM